MVRSNLFECDENSIHFPNFDVSFGGKEIYEVIKYPTPLSLFLWIPYNLGRTLKKMRLWVERKLIEFFGDSFPSKILLFVPSNTLTYPKELAQWNWVFTYETKIPHENY